jgi:uncharacterized iron-regulated protein
MFKKYILITFLCCINSFAFSQTKPAYLLYDSNGKKVNYSKMLRNAQKNQVILFGEFHDNAIAHWLQLELTKDINKKVKIVQGAEMFETDNQIQINEYLNNEIDEKQLDTTARLWKNFKTDYKPLLDFAKNNKTAFIATNIPRKYAKLVYLNGFEALDSLPENEKQWIAPLPILYDAELPAYKAMLEMMGGHGGENLPKAQAIKDATMAQNILQNLSQGEIFIHYNGSYHSNDYEGIYWYLKQKNAALKIVTITVVSQENIKKLLAENKGLADFIICVDEDMTTTY